MTTPSESTTDTIEPDTNEPNSAPTNTKPEDTEDTTEPPEESPNKEAAKWRTKLRAVEAERDQLREQLTAQQRAVIDWRSATAVRGAVDPQLLDAAGIDITELLDDNGHLDMNLVDQFIDGTATKFRVHRTIKPNPQQGNPSEARGGGLVGMFQQDQFGSGR